MPVSQETFEVQGCFGIAETQQAVLVEGPFPNGEDRQWIPKSQIHEDSEVWKKDTDGTLIVTEWIAKEKGWT